MKLIQNNSVCSCFDSENSLFDHVYTGFPMKISKNQSINEYLMQQKSHQLESSQKTLVLRKLGVVEQSFATEQFLRNF